MFTPSVTKRMGQGTRSVPAPPAVPESRMSVPDYDNIALQKARRGTVKLDSKQSQITQQTVAKKEQKEQFEQAADATLQKMQDQKCRAIDYSNQFWKFINDTTLESEKGPMAKNLEKEILGNLLLISEEMNNDENQSIGSGCNVVSLLCLRAVLNLRDKNNDLRYKVYELEKKVLALESINKKENV